MASILTNIKIQWAYDPDISSVLVEYKKETDSTYIKPTNETNPTKESSYPLQVEADIYYNVRLTSTKTTSCLPLPKVYRFKVTPPPPPETNYCCPSGYTLTPDSSGCYKIEEVAAIPPSGGTPQNAVASPNIVYSSFGTYIYNAGYAVNGTGTSSQIDFNNPFWINDTNSTSDGPLNRCALWTASPGTDQDVGFSICLNVTNTKTYYVGIGTDNYGIIKLDGNVIITQDPTALGSQYGGSEDIAFKIWHVYPVQISSGPHILELIAHNVGATPAGLGAEIYDNTKEELIAAAGYADLNLIFSTKDYIGQPIQIGTGGTGYTCPSGYALASCADPVVCRKTLTATPTPC